jgi:hypothetical protein
LEEVTMSIKRSRVVLTPGEELPYKVVLEHSDGCSEYPVATIREGEALIRENSPPPPPTKVEKLREWSGREQA